MQGSQWIFFAPCSNKIASEHFEDTILKGVTLERIKAHLKQDDLETLKGKELLRVWGNTPGSTAQRGGFMAMELGDVILFYRNMKFIYAGKVAYKTDNIDLAKTLWPDFEEGNPWRFIYFLDEPREIDIPLSLIRDFSEYKPGYIVQRFQSMNSKAMKKIIQNYASIDNFLKAHQKRSVATNITDQMCYRILSVIDADQLIAEHVTPERIQKWTEVLKGFSAKKKEESYEDWISKYDYERLKELYNFITAMEELILKSSDLTHVESFRGLTSVESAVLCGFRDLQRKHLKSSEQINMNAHKYNVLKRQLFKSNPTNYWIFVVTAHSKSNLSAEQIIETRVTDNFWGLNERTANQKKLKQGDKIIFSKGAQFFVGIATLASDSFELDPNERKQLRHDNEFYDTQYGVKLKDIQIWNSQKPVRDYVEKLEFIKRKDNPVLHFQGGVCSISKIDYELITMNDTVDIKTNLKFWKISPGKGARYWNDFKKQGMMAIGWLDRLGDLRKIGDYQEIRDRAFKENYSIFALNQAWDFYNNVKIGDIVVAFGKGTIIDIGKVSGEYYFEDSEEKSFADGEIFGHRRGVTWFNLFDEPFQLKNDRELYTALRWPVDTLHEIKGKGVQKIIMDILSGQGVIDSKLPQIPTINEIIKNIQSRGFYYPEETIINYHTSLLTKPFVILAGITGIGKTKLTELYANALHTDDEENKYYKIIPVQPNWNDKKPLLGYYNPIMEKYFKTPFLNFLLKAIDDCEKCELNQNNECTNKMGCDKKYFVCLDEMNLAHVEYYFADFLSAMESNQQLELNSTQTKTQDGTYMSPKIHIPENFHIIGTVNIDETTKEFSPKVLDRANTIYLNTVDLDQWIQLQSKNGKVIQVEPFEVLKKIHDILKKHEMHFGYRTSNEILDYVQNSVLPNERAIDLQILQKILPKFCGDDNVRLRDSLQDLFDYLDEEKYPISKNKVKNMLIKLDQQGFTSFFD